MSDDTTAQALAEVVRGAARMGAHGVGFTNPDEVARAVLNSGLVVSQAMYDTTAAFGALAVKERDYERVRVDRLTRERDEARAELAERDATIARVREVCAAARDAGNALVFCISVESALDGGGG